MSNFKIAFIHEIYPFGGKEEITNILADFFNQNNIEVFVYSCVIDTSKSLNNNCRYNLLPDRNIASDINSEFLINEICANNIDIFIVPDYNIPLESIRQECECKIIYVLHSTPFWEITVKYELAKLRSTKSLLKKLEWHVIQFWRYDVFRLHERKIRNNYREILANVDRFITLTDGYSQKIISELSLSKEFSNKLSSISNPLSSIIFNNQEFVNKQKEVLYVGRLSYADKRVDRLLNIWKYICINYPDWNLKIVGDGPEMQNLKNLAETLGLINICFEGYHDDVSAYYNKGSILCMTSTFEGWPLSLSEAQAYGVIPIAFNCSAGVEKIISPNGVNGFLITPFDITQFANQLEELMQDEEMRKRMAKAVQQKSKEYSLSNIGKQWLGLFNELMSR